MIIDDPLNENNLTNKTEMHFLFLYSIEIGIKIIGFGIFIGEKRIIGDNWNLFDLLIILSSWINFLLQDV